MKKTITENEFIEAFKRMGRETQFSRAGLRALFSYLEELEKDTGDEIELDVIALCCDYAEYESLASMNQDYVDAYASIDEVASKTTVIPIDDESFIIQQF